MSLKGKALKGYSGIFEVGFYGVLAQSKSVSHTVLYVGYRKFPESFEFVSRMNPLKST